MQIRVYYEDTDAGGVVYHANYLKFAERARTETLRALGFENSTTAKNQGVYVVVRHLEADYKAPARLDDILNITTQLIDLRNASFTMQQDIKRDDVILVSVKVVLACVDSGGCVARIPVTLRDCLKRMIKNDC